MRYFFVNAVTGEKSADILKEVELGQTNDPFDEGQQNAGGGAGGNGGNDGGNGDDQD